MRLIRRFAASFWLGFSLIGSLILGSGAMLAVDSSPAQAAAPAGSTVAAVTPSSTTPGGKVTFAVSCSSTTATSATLFGSTLGLPQMIPMQAGAASGDFVISVTLPDNIQPGTYHPSIDCSDGTSTTAMLRVTAFPAQGGAQTGDGTTSTQTNTGLAAGGLALIAIGAVAGGIAVRRRSSGNQQ